MNSGAFFEKPHKQERPGVEVIRPADAAASPDPDRSSYVRRGSQPRGFSPTEAEQKGSPQQTDRERPDRLRLLVPGGRRREPSTSARGRPESYRGGSTLVRGLQGVSGVAQSRVIRSLNS
ncbi:hypothetical protein ACP70R_031340 [Stipagrostis hirtigluma subsp. patula]